MQNPQKKLGYLSKNTAIFVVVMTCISLINLIILYFTFTPVPGGSEDLDLPYSIFTHSISKLGRLENQPTGAWILWCIAMIGFGISIVLVLKSFYRFMNQFNPENNQTRFQHIIRKSAWICLFIGAFGVILVGFFPLSDSNGIYTEHPHRIIIILLIFLILGWILLYKDMRKLITALKKSFVPFSLQYISGIIVMGLTIYWVIVKPEGGFFMDGNLYLLWGFWSYVLAEWLALLLIIVFVVMIFFIMVHHQETASQ
jgi:hypothetical protein